MVERADTTSCSAGNPAWRRRLSRAAVTAIGAAGCVLTCAAASSQTLPSRPVQTTPWQPALTQPPAVPGQTVTPTWNGLVLWSVPLDSQPSTPPAFDARMMYAPLRDGSLVAVDHATGEPVWIVPRTASETPLALPGILVGVDGSTVWALASGSGDERWTQTIDGAAVQPPAGADWSVAVATDGGEIVQLDATTGAVTWRCPLGAKATARPAVQDNRVFAGLEDGRVVAIDAASGRVAWTRRLNGRVLALTALPDRLLAGGTDDFFYSLSPRDGGVQWQWRVGGDVNSLAVADASRVYFVAMDNMVRALDRKRGNLRWQRPLQSRPVGSPILFREFVVLAHVAPELRCFDSVTGAPACLVGLPGRAVHEPFLPNVGTTNMPRLVYLSGGGQATAVGPSPEPYVEKWIRVPGSPLPPEEDPGTPLPLRTKKHWPEPDLVSLGYAPGRRLPDEWDPVAPLPVPGRRAWPEPDLVKWASIPGRVLPPEAPPGSRRPAR